ncbi:MAG: hypothetical protein M3H12_03190 [Chromatiales bacterium]
MEHAQKMVLVDPRLLNSLGAPQRAPTDTLGKKVHALDDDMQVILESRDLADWDKVVMYNQVLQHYNALAVKRVKEPVRVVSVKDEGGPAATAAAAGAAAVAIGAPAPPEAGMVGMDADVVDSVPKVLPAKASRLIERLKRDIAWIARGELVHEAVPVPGSNVVDFVNDLLRRKKKTVGDPTG